MTHPTQNVPGVDLRKLQLLTPGGYYLSLLALLLRAIARGSISGWAVGHDFIAAKTLEAGPILLAFFDQIAKLNELTSVERIVCF
jgi:hypothetical protein